MNRPPRVVIKPRRARPFFARHPWVFVTSIASVEGEPTPGTEVDVHSAEGKFIARGLFNPYSAIRVRLYRWDEGPLDEAFWTDRLSAAIRLRTNLLNLDAPRAGYRLIFSEADGLSGLVADRYDRWMVVQFTSAALYERRELILDRLVELTGVEGIALRTEKGIAEQEALEAEDGVLRGTLPSAPIDLVEHEITYQVDLRTGQKTGFYLDQRVNRQAVAELARGRRVLDLFCYTGGFALNALKHGGAASALGIDVSSTAIEFARQNAIVNRLSSARFETSDVFEALDTLRSSGQRFGLVICDPPKFARHPKAVEDALKGYLKLNRAVLDVLEPDGVLATCSCSGLVERELFIEVLGQVAEQSGRPIQILRQLGQPPDHPVSASCLETEYLKCILCRVG